MLNINTRLPSRPSSRFLLFASGTLLFLGLHTRATAAANTGIQYGLIVLHGVHSNEAPPTMDHKIKPPLIIGHRGGQMGVWQENSMSAFRACARTGNPIECDVQALSDGTLVVMHDATVDRTTTSTGKVSTYNPDTWRQLRMKTFNKSIPPSEPPPFFSDVLKEFGNKVLILPEIKTSSVRISLVDAIVNARISKKRVIIQSTDLSWLKYAHSKNYKTMFIINRQTNASPTELATDRDKFAAIDQSLSIDFVRSFIKAGIKVVIYCLDNNTTLNHWHNIPLWGIMTNNLKAVVYLQKSQSNISNR